MLFNFTKNMWISFTEKKQNRRFENENKSQKIWKSKSGIKKNLMRVGELVINKKERKKKVERPMRVEIFNFFVNFFFFLIRKKRKKKKKMWHTLFFGLNWNFYLFITQKYVPCIYKFIYKRFEGKKKKESHDVKIQIFYW